MQEVTLGWGRMMVIQGSLPLGSDILGVMRYVDERRFRDGEDSSDKEAFASFRELAPSNRPKDEVKHLGKIHLTTLLALLGAQECQDPRDESTAC